MATRYRAIVQTTLFGLALLLPITATANQHNVSTDQLIERIVQDVVDVQLERAREKVREHTGIDPLRRGFDWEREDYYYPPVSRDIGDERRSELQQLSAEYDRKIAGYERELERELAKARSEFAREAEREERRDKVLEKRRKLERKVDKAYARFQKKVNAANRKYDERRSDLVYRDERGRGNSEYGRYNSDKRNERGKENRGKGNDDW
ncbi:hypothetical protein [Marinobacter alexandrii]|jgi:Skp family chaperone for outer membrane proteins|uniref:hypothetical protein n=1 Tax=Marinobacter alexandrii TaxID=2570351 RepID=UPI002ABE0FE6|nr:hypothetical protein [Marinobacter alexandrii]